MLKLIAAAAVTTLLSFSSASAQNTIDVKCVQQGLLDAGFNPNGVDGAVGGGTRKALAQWLQNNPSDLEPLSSKNAPSWCRLLKANAPQSKVPAGTYRAVFTARNNNRSVNRCGILEVDYTRGHFYRFGLCDSSVQNIASNAKVSETAQITVTDTLIKIIDATYEILDIKNGDMIGQWELGNERNDFLTFKKVSE